MSVQRDDTQFSSGTRNDLSVMARMWNGVRGTIAGATSAWFGPMQPLIPMASPAPDAGVVGRRFDYTTGYNLNQQPRAYEPVGFADLRALAANCDVMRLVIETRKDQLGALDWNIRVKPEPGEDARRVKATPDQKNRIKLITEFFQYPDKEMPFEQWQRAFLEDHFVIDAPVIYRRPTKGGKLYALELIDGGTISPKLSATGRRPLPPDVAYQQILKGIPAADYTSDEIHYCMRNASTNKVYGRSQVEQVILTANIAIRRAIFQLEYYTKGTQPDAFLGLPETWSIDQIKTFQDWLDSLKAQRRMLRAIPVSGHGVPYSPTKEPVLKDEYDDYLNRLICFAFSVSPTALVKMMNRAQSESQHDQALEEGNGPTMKYLAGVYTRILSLDFESPDLEFVFMDEEHVDPQTQSEIDGNDVGNGIKSIDEAREGRGLDPLGGAAASPMVKTATGYVPIGANVPSSMGGDMEEINDAKPQPPALAGKVGPGGKPLPPANDDPKPGDKIAEKLAKLHKPGYKFLAPASAKRKTITAAKKRLTARLATMLRDLGKHSAGQFGHLTKADEKKKRPLDAAAVTRAVDSADLSVMSLIAVTTSDDAERIAREAGHEALARVGVAGKSELVNQVSESALEYARQRAAYLVGKRINADGSIVDADGAFSIEATTRDALRTRITDYLSQENPEGSLADAIESDFAFSEERAALIASTEIANANSAGALAGYKAAASAGVEVMKAWSIADDSCCDDCEQNEAQGPIPLDEDFQSGDDAPLAHPNCRCVLLSVVGDEEEETDE